MCKGQDKSQNKQAWYIIGSLCSEQEKSVKKNPISYSYTTELPGRGFSICQRIIRIINKEINGHIRNNSFTTTISRSCFSIAFAFSYSRGGVNQMWILKNSEHLLE